MEVEFTARQGKISKALRRQAEEGMERIGRILGKNAQASVIFSAVRHVQTVELTVKGRVQKFAAEGHADTPDSALRQALAHAEAQARRYSDKRLASKRLPREEKVLTEPPVARPKARAAEPEDDSAGARAASNGVRPRANAARPRASIAVHSFPAQAAVVEPHVVQSGEAIALKPMTIEEAVKDAEFRDRDLLIVRTVAGDMFVLHRRRDGQMELVEIP
ncbi:MAG: HPF/RaiA family ribosome-associated protein [Terracidiphilus sp.]